MFNSPIKKIVNSYSKSSVAAFAIEDSGCAHTSFPLTVRQVLERRQQPRRFSHNICSKISHNISHISREISNFYQNRNV